MAKISSHILLSGLLFAASVIGAGFVFAFTSPAAAGPWLFGLAYLLIFAGIASLAALAGYSFRLVFWRQGVRYEFIKSAERQGVLLGIFAVILVLLSRAEFLNLRTAIPLTIVFLLIELYLY